MKIYENGIIREMTAEEIAALQEAALSESGRMEPLTNERKMELFLAAIPAQDTPTLAPKIGYNRLRPVGEYVIHAVQKKRGKATSQDTHLAEIDKKLGKMQEHQDEQYLAILRLTIMSEEMPMGERLIAGQKYVNLGGNGDVKKFLHQLEAQCGHSNGV